MKHLFNNISQDEKQRILEMHKGTKMVFNEQTTTQEKINWKGQIKVGDVVVWDGTKQPEGTEELVKELQINMQNLKPEQANGILDNKLAVLLLSQVRINGKTHDGQTITSTTIPKTTST